ncbi:tannase/feruloyl esterase family alpha/beta hydrolase [Rhizobium sp. RCC_161_2]|uniref:tannase/feruloyl esterase family alpha/beta hydrolase n=1 Tax=Rhizobium sp. RCC_161_2 TaxID=3239219 RepID=UPI003526A233
MRVVLVAWPEATSTARKAGSFIGSNSTARHSRQRAVPEHDQFTRLYLFPGIYHCDGGEGPNKIDLLTSMLNWVEKGTAPQEIVARQTADDDASGFGQPSGAPTRLSGHARSAPILSPQNTAARAIRTSQPATRAVTVRKPSSSLGLARISISPTNPTRNRLMRPHDGEASPSCSSA